MSPTALYCTAALGALLFGLGLAVSIRRKQSGMLCGAPDDGADPLYRLVRAHANTAQYAPFLAILFLFLGSREPSPWICATMIAATICRYLLVAGLLAYPSMDKANPLRFLGALGTYLTGIALCMALITNA